MKTQLMSLLVVLSITSNTLYAATPEFYDPFARAVGAMEAELTEQLPRIADDADVAAESAEAPGRAKRARVEARWRKRVLKRFSRILDQYERQLNETPDSDLVARYPGHSAEEARTELIWAFTRRYERMATILPKRIAEAGGMVPFIGKLRQELRREKANAVAKRAGGADRRIASFCVDGLDEGCLSFAGTLLLSAGLVLLLFGLVPLAATVGGIGIISILWRLQEE
jgi:hypothetical protein